MNYWVPGNAGVRITPAAPEDEGDRLEDGAKVTLETSALGAFPPGFWIAVGILVVFVAVTAVVFSILRSLLVLGLGAAGIFFAVTYFLTAG